MVIPIQYKNSFSVFEKTATTDDDGNPITDNTTIVFEGKCRFEINTKNQYISSVDGSQISYSATVYFPLPKRLDINVGMYINILIDSDLKISDLGLITSDNYNIVAYEGGLTMITAKVLAIDKGSQLNNRLWV